MTSKNLALFVLTLITTAACGGGGGGSSFTGDLTPNAAPLVNAGVDTTIRLPDNVVSLDGTVSDDGRPASGTVSTSWIVQSGPTDAVFADVNAVDTTITFISDGTYELQLTANDTELQGSDTVTVIVEAAPALASIAVAPANVSLFTNSTQTFSASGTDQYGAAFATNVTWSATGGTINQAGEYLSGTTLGTFDVTATDGAVSGTAGVTISDSPPSADAGGPYFGVEGSVVALNGSASTDPNDDIVSYQWDLDNDGAYDDAVGISTNYSAASSGVFTIGLQVTDADGGMATDTAEVTVANVAPTAVAGGPYSGDQAANISVDGSASVDPGNDIVTWEWDFNNDGAYDDGSGQLTFFNSVSTGVFPIGLLVTDADGATATASANVTVNNVAPTANAGGPYSGDQGDSIALDGSTSSDPGNNIVSYEWDLDNDGSYDDATGATTTFSSTDTGVFTVGLRVTDGDGGSNAAAATVNVGNVGPTADAGGPYSGDQGANIALDGSASSDPGNNIVSYEWDLDNDGAFDNATGQTPDFLSIDTGTFTIGLRVTDGEGDTGIATATVTVANVAPTADAGGPYAGNQAATIALDGSASSDPGNNIVSYEWDLDNDGAYDDATGATTTFVSNAAGVFTVGLKVTDGDTASTTATATVTVANVAPTADAGPDQAGVLQGATVILDGSGSSDVGGDALTYAWTLTAPAGSAAVLSSATVMAPTFDTDKAGSYVAELVVNDGTIDSVADTVTITVDNVAPTANAGADQPGVLQGATVTLDGSASSDAGGDALTYAWTLTSIPAGSAAVLSSATAVGPTFVVDVAGSYEAELVVNDGTVNSTADTVTVTVGNVAPVANAGPDQAGVLQGATATLDGSGSSDPGGDALTYAWTLTLTPAGSAAVLSDATAVAPTFNTDKAGSYVAELVVNDGTSNSTADAVTITVDNVAPTANAGPDQPAVSQGATVTLDGSGSSDPGGDTLTYAWSLTTIPAGSAAALSSTTAVNPTFDTDVVGSYVAELVVDDGTANSAADTVTITVANVAPTANAGPDQPGVSQGATVTLDGSGSSDPGGDALTYAWSLTTKPAGSAAVLSSATAVGPTFDTDKVGSYVAELVVNDGTANSAADTVTITVANVAPTANAGPDQPGVIEGATVTLDGSGSSDAGGDALTYAWSLTSKPAGSTAVLSSATAIGPTFDTDVAGSYVAELVVNDGTANSAADTVTVTVANVAPTANAGGAYTGDQGESIVLDASGSSDAGGSIVSYEWDFDADTFYDDATGVNAVFPSGASGTFPIGLRVTDDDGDTATAATTVTIADIGLAAYWRLDEGTGTTAADAAGGSNGTLVGATWGTGVRGSALSFNGTSDYVSIDNTAALNITGTAITLSAWINPTKGDVVNGSRMISKRTDAGGTEVYAMILDQYRLRFRLDGVDMAGPIVRLNDWTHVAMVYDGTDKRIYINGVLDASPPQAKTDAIDASTRAVQLGWREGEARHYQGRIDEAQVYDVALTPAQVAALYARDTAPATPAGLYFSDITFASGTAGFSNSGHAVAFAEVDNDSLPDLYVTNVNGVGNVGELFYDNTDGAVFAEVAAARNIDDVDGGSIGAVFADLDNDGDYDLFNGTVWPAGGPLGTGNPEHDNVFRNDGLGVFTELTSSSPDMLATKIETGGVTALDWDADGDLDLVGVPGGAGNEPIEAFVNNGNFTFSTWTGGGDLATAITDEGVLATDYDGDGDIDILAGNQVGDFVILDNNGSGFFTKIAPLTLGIFSTELIDGVTTADIDNDGDLDMLWVKDGTGFLYRRDGANYVGLKVFDDIDGKMGGFADVDNDGDLDLVFAGDEKVWRNNGTGGFSPAQSVPVSQIAAPFSIAFADIEGDGDLDFAISAFGSRNYLVRNDLDGTGANWLKVELAWGIAAGQCQAGAFGAKTRVYAAGDLDGTQLGLRESTGNRGYVAQDDPVLHFGLGAVSSVDIRVTFVDGSTTTRLGVASNQRIKIDECP